MRITIKHARLAFPHLWEPQVPQNGKGEAACNGNFILDPKKAEEKAELDKVIKTMQQVATEKWGAKAGDVFKTLKAKGDLCLHDGSTKAEYDGFEGNFFVSARNKAKPVVVANRKFNGKPIEIDEAGNAFINGERQRDLPFDVKAPYSGCYVDVQVDIWAQDNAFGKRINAKLLAVKFNEDGDAFSGGEGFDENDFDFEDGGNSAGGSGGDDFGFGDSSSAGGSGDDGFFGGDSASEDSSGFF